MNSAYQQPIPRKCRKQFWFFLILAKDVYQDEKTYETEASKFYQQTALQKNILCYFTTASIKDKVRRWTSVKQICVFFK